MSANLAESPGGPGDHGALSGLTDDDHLQYLLLAGRAGGQQIDLQAGGGISIHDNATPIGSDLFDVADNAGNPYFAVSDSDIDMGLSSRRILQALYGASTGRGGFELWPDTITITTALSPLAMFQWTGTMTSNIAGGGGLGNDSFGGFISITGEFIYADQGNLFNSGLLFNFAMTASLQASIGPLYTLIDQPTFRSISAGAKTVSQHNAVRAQPRWGPNTAGTITQTSAQLYFATASVDASGGAAAITTLEYFSCLAPTLTGGGTIGTLNAISIANITGPTTIRGIYSLMSSGQFIRHEGTAPVQLGGDLQLGAGTTFDWIISRAAANRADIATGDSLRFVNGSLQFVGTSGQLSSSVNGEIQFDVTRLGFNVAPAAANWAFAFSAVARTITVGGDFANCLNTAGGNHTIDAALSTFTQWTVNAPAGTIGTGSLTDAANMLVQTAPSIGTNRYGLLITSNPSGGTLNYAFRQSNASARARFDGRLDINRGVALGGGGTATLGTIGGSGPTATAQAQWLEIDIGGTPHWIPVWT